MEDLPYQTTYLPPQNVHRQWFSGSSLTTLSILKISIFTISTTHITNFLFQESGLSVNSSPGEKESLRWGCLHDAQGDFSRGSCGALQMPVPVMGWNCGVLFQQKISDFLSVCLSDTYSICTPSNEEQAVLRFEKALTYSHWNLIKTCEEWLYRNIIPALLPALEAPNQEL